MAAIESVSQRAVVTQTMVVQISLLSVYFTPLKTFHKLLAQIFLNLMNLQRFAHIHWYLYVAINYVKE